MVSLAPILSSQAGSCLTIKNWQQAGITQVSYRLEDLLMKPGLDTLQAQPNLRSYTAWDGELILNANLTMPETQGSYTIRNIYDGGKTVITLESLYDLIHKLQPDRVLLPKGSAQFQHDWQELSATCRVYFYFQDNMPPATPIYLEAEFVSTLASEKFNQTSEVLIQGDVTLEQVSQLPQDGNYLIESDKPAKDGMEGITYGETELLNLLDKRWENDHQLIDYRCACQTCTQKFTRAYLHHLIQHTPLLAQRYLIGHNVYYYQHHLNAFHHLRANEIPI